MSNSASRRESGECKFVGFASMNNSFTNSVFYVMQCIFGMLMFNRVPKPQICLLKICTEGFEELVRVHLNHRLCFFGDSL